MDSPSPSLDSLPAEAMEPQKPQSRSSTATTKVGPVVHLSSVAGVRSSLKAGHSLVSSGSSALDAIVGGGFHVGSVVMVEEHSSPFGTLGDVLTRLFVADGVHHDHAVYVASGGRQAYRDLAERIPRPAGPSSMSSADSKSLGPNSKPGSMDGGDMAIAWRYENLEKVVTEVSSKNVGVSYDLSKSLDSSVVAEKDFTFVNLLEWGGNVKCLQYVMDGIAAKLRENSFSGTAPPKSGNVQRKPNIFRIVLRDFGSTSWTFSNPCSTNTRRSPNPSLCLRLLIALRSLVQRNNAVLVLTVQPDLMIDHDDDFSAGGSSDQTIIHRLRLASDYVIVEESFIGCSEKQRNPLYADYDGLVKVMKTSHVNCVLPFIPDSQDYGYIVKRKKLNIERLHLPPDLSETASRSSQVPAGGSGGHSCASNMSQAKLDF